MVAPGLSCQYPIKFAPDSLADYDDFIKVIIVHVNLIVQISVNQCFIVSLHCINPRQCSNSGLV